ncbi:MAG: hypothetical protein IBJ04_18740 [Hydrogenophaga sp.]|uniref:hypothetical protein n=1 Tax=Hydrogenophaga sp. TaxID=1904254 RepID=UPI00257BAC3F|nr:hypothetical protein [Hydrogenophaga sp.]MBL0946356.1 hypothetical protein [Hydrogenophaga sp.]
MADLMLDSARRLQAAGAAFLVCPDNTIHEAMPLVRPGDAERDELGRLTMDELVMGVFRHALAQAR